MYKNFKDIMLGYSIFRDKYAHGDASVMQDLSEQGQQPEIMVVACCDSRVDPALIFQCNPGDLFVVRNVANIVPPYEKDAAHHGMSAALEFAIRVLKVKDLILLGHSQCGGIKTLLHGKEVPENDFITNWVSVVINTDAVSSEHPDDYAKAALQQSYQNCKAFPWIKEKIDQGELAIHVWFFDIKTGQIFTYSKERDVYEPL